MRRLVVHAGNLKCGSTAIQIVLLRGREAINESGYVHIPDFKGGSGAFGALARELAGLETRNPNPPSWASVREEISESAARAAIISSEVLIRADPVKVKAALETFDGWRPEIYFYVRPHIAMFTSNYLQELKIGLNGRDPFAAAKRHFRSPEMNFVSVLDQWRAVMGDTSIRVREFAREKFAGGDVVTDFFEFTGLPGLSDGVSSEARNAVNASPSAEIASLLFGIRNILPTPRSDAQRRSAQEKHIFRPLQNRFKRLFAGEKTTQFRLPISLQILCRDKFEDSRRSFADKWFETPPTEGWLREEIAAPEPLCPLPADKVARPVRATAANCQAAGMLDEASALRAFLDSLPISSIGGDRMIHLENFAESA